MTRRFATLFLVFAALDYGQSTTGWKLAWSDEFNGAAGSAPDPVKWGYDTGGGGWGNNELEVYTASTSNAYQDGQGHLVIQALSANGGYTSARMKTQATFSFTYGMVEARIKMPYAQGIWPAFWMLGSNISVPAVGWPACGEIDIMENFGAATNDAAINRGSVHGPNFTGAPLGGVYTLSGGGKLADDFHLYRAVWGPGSLQFFVDGVLYFQAAPADLVPYNGKWVFDNNPMFLLLNVAVGGGPAGYPNSSTAFPQQMLVDYVRVYQQTSVPAGTPNINPHGVVDGALASANIAAGGLASVYGQNLAEGTYPSLFNSQAGAFPTSTPSGVSVLVNGVAAPLTYVSPQQINFEVPWSTPSNGAAVNVAVARGSNAGFAEPVAFASSAPGVFYSAGAAQVTGCTPKAGATCVMWGNGFGAVASKLSDGVPAPPAVNPVTGGCTLTIGGAAAAVSYCGSAPGLVIDQLNFTYPAVVPGTGPTVPAVPTVNGASVNLVLPVNR